MICLIPELCYMTGLTDEIRQDFRVMKVKIICYMSQICFSNKLANHLHMVLNYPLNNGHWKLYA